VKKIDSTLLEKLEKLSMLQIEDKEKVLEELNRFLEFVEILQELNIEEEEATFNPLNASAPLREDEVELDPSIPQEVLKHAPQAEDNFFIVPKIIE